MDQTQEEIVVCLRLVGASVQLLHTVGKGCPDSIIGFKGKTYLAEFKTGEKAEFPWRGQGLHQAGPCLSSNSVGDDGHIAGFADEQLGSGHAMSGDVRGAVVQDADGGAVFDSALKAVMRSRLDGYGSGYVECFVRHDFLPVNAPSLAHGLNHITSIKTSQALFSTFDCAEQQWRQA